MKTFKIAACALAMAMICFCSCNKDEKEYPVGGYQFGNIFILNGGLHEAHNSQMVVPSVEGYKDLDVVSSGLTGFDRLDGVEDIDLEFLFSFPPSEADLLTNGYSYYRQTVRVHYKKNPSYKKTRSAKFRLFAQGGNGFAADVEIVQSTLPDV